MSGPQVIAVALRRIQQAVKPIRRDSLNEDTQTKYSSVVALWTELRKAFAREKLSYTQSASIAQIGPMFVVSIQTMLMHESGETMTGMMQLPFVPGSTQQGAAAVTFAKRMGLASICGAVSELEDRDGQGQPEPEPVIEKRTTMLLKAHKIKGVGKYFEQKFDVDSQTFYCANPPMARLLAETVGKTVTLILKGYADGSVEIVDYVDA